MEVLIVYDSFFGDTDGVAQAMGNAPAAQAEVEVLRVSNVKPEQVSGVDVWKEAGIPREEIVP